MEAWKWVLAVSSTLRFRPPTFQTDGPQCSAPKSPRSLLADFSAKGLAEKGPTARSGKKKPGSQAQQGLDALRLPLVLCIRERLHKALHNHTSTKSMEETTATLDGEVRYVLRNALLRIGLGMDV